MVGVILSPKSLELERRRGSNFHHETQVKVLISGIKFKRRMMARLSQADATGTEELRECACIIADDFAKKGPKC
jgi:hypothetical protein